MSDEVLMAGRDVKICNLKEPQPQNKSTHTSNIQGEN